MPGKLVKKKKKRKCFTLTEVDTIKTASQNLHEKKIGSMPILIEDRKLLGIVSIGDVVDHLINKIKEENESLREYINSY